MSWFQIIENILPFVAIQLYIFCLLYLLITRKRFRESFAFLALFLVAMICFLSFYLVDSLIPEIRTLPLIQARMAVLFAIGFPSLTIANSKLCQSPVSKAQTISLYGLGGLAAMSHSFILASGWKSHFGINRMYFSDLFPEFHAGFLWAQAIAITTTVGLVIIPCSFQLISFKQRDLKGNAFVTSAILFALLFIIGIFTKQWWIYYVGSIMCASIFLAAVYIDIHHLSQTAAFVKDALRQQVLSGRGDSRERVVELVESLEASSQGNLEIYKMRIREVLSMIADDAIESGGDVSEILKRNQEHLSKIDQADDLETLSKVTEHEAQELSDIIVNIPNQRRIQVIQEVKDFVADNLDKDLKIGTLSNEFHVSKSYLTNSFKEVEGDTLNQYISNVRIEKAKVLLKSQSVTETAFDVGFSNSNYFSTVFKKLTGQTPKEYQDRFKSEVL